MNPRKAEIECAILKSEYAIKLHNADKSDTVYLKEILMDYSFKVMEIMKEMRQQGYEVHITENKNITFYPRKEN